MGNINKFKIYYTIDDQDYKIQGRKDGEQSEEK